MTTSLLITLIFSCAEDEVIEYTSCNVHLQEEIPLQPNTTQTLYVAPVSNLWDTQVLIDAQQAQIVAVERNTCGACDECRIEADCDTCESCPSCEALCDPNVCVESISIEVPNLETPYAQLQIINLYGYSPVYNLNVEASEE